MDELLERFLRRIHKESGKLDDSEYRYYQDILEDAISAVMNKMRPFGYTEEQKVEGIKRYSDVVVRVADYIYSKDGASGETSHTANGVTRQYASGDIPAEMLRSVTPYCTAF